MPVSDERTGEKSSIRRNAQRAGDTLADAATYLYRNTAVRRYSPDLLRPMPIDKISELAIRRTARVGQVATEQPRHMSTILIDATERNARSLDRREEDQAVADLEPPVVT